MGITDQFLKFALLGAEWVMVLLILCSVLSLAIICERAVYFFKLSGDFAIFIKNLNERLNAFDNMEKTAAWCAGQTLLEANVAAVGLERAGQPLSVVENSMAATMIAARTRLDRGLSILGTLGNNTPFIGLFGTILGIIQAFHALSTDKGMGPEVVMASLSEALVATAVGLLVAIPAVVAYNVFLRLIKVKMSNTETTTRILLTHLGRKDQNS